MEHAPIVFGTDGWRGRIARDLTFDSVRRVVTAAAAWTIDETNLEPGDPWTLPVVFDSRFLSPELAAESATLLASQGFRVLLSDRPVPTPCASWHVASRGLRAGLAITASHNPPLWNGVKVNPRLAAARRPPRTTPSPAPWTGPSPEGGGGRRDARPRDAVSRRARGPRRSRRDPPGRPEGPLRRDPRSGRDLLETIVGAGHPTTSCRSARTAIRSLEASTPSRFPRISPRRSRPSPRSASTSSSRATGTATGSACWTRAAVSSRRTVSSRSSPRASRSRTHPRRHREDVLDLAAPRPRRLAPRRAAPRHAGRLQAHRREDALWRGRDRRRGVGRPGRRVPPARARRQSSRRSSSWRRSRTRAARSRPSWPGRMRPMARSPTAAATSICRCRCSTPSSRA